MTAITRYQENIIVDHLQKMICFANYCSVESELCGSTDSGAFLKDIADRMAIQLIIVQRMANTCGLTITSPDAFQDSACQYEKLCGKRLEDIFDYIHKQSMLFLKLLTFRAMEDGTVFKAMCKRMSELEEDFLNYVETIYVHYLRSRAEQTAHNDDLQTVAFERAVTVA